VGEKRPLTWRQGENERLGISPGYQKNLDIKKRLESNYWGRRLVKVTQGRQERPLMKRHAENKGKAPVHPASRDMGSGAGGVGRDKEEGVP